MPANKNALIRYKTIDRCLRNRYRRWTLDDLIEACSDALYEFEGRMTPVSRRTVQADICDMRSDRLGYNAPIEVYDRKFYRYSDPDYSIMSLPMTETEYDIMTEVVDMLRELQDFDHFQYLSDVVGRLRDHLSAGRPESKPIIHFDSMPLLKGLNWLNPLYNHIARRTTVRIDYRSFSSPAGPPLTVYPHILKEFRNRWFLFCTASDSGRLLNLALDRIENIEPQPDIPYRRNQDFDPATFFNDVIGVTKNLRQRPHTVLFEASPYQTKYIITKPVHPSQRLISSDPITGWTRFEIDVVINFEFFSVMMSYCDGVRVLKPDFVRRRIASIVRRLAENYNSSRLP